MSYQVFARKYRPRVFDDVLGQDHVIRTLKNAIEKKRLAHAYLFVGPRGTGKTTTARILAKALNCSGGPRADFDPEEDICVEIAEGRSMDVLEIDGASNNGVENIRNLREQVGFSPARGNYRIFYIDEVHMLSTQAFNALLKTLEEPPPHVKFIFATTEPHKILPTILSRCQRFDLRPIPADIIAKHLLFIAKEEGVALSETAAWAIAKGADGGMRDAQSMLDQLVAFCGDKIEESNVLDIFGFTSAETVSALATAILERDTPAALACIQRESEAGRDLPQLLGELINTLRALLVQGIDSNTPAVGIPAEYAEKLGKLSSALQTDRLLAVIDDFAATESRLRWSTSKRLHLELGIIKAIQTLGEVRVSDLIKVLGKTADRMGDFKEMPNAAEIPAQVTDKAAENHNTPAQEEPAPAEPATAPRSSKTPKKTPPRQQKASMADDIDALIAAAPEQTVIPEKPKKKASKQEDVPPKEEASKAPEPEEDEFYKDPLIQKALEIFEAKLV